MEMYGMKKESGLSLSFSESSPFDFWDRELGSRGFESDVTYGSAHETWYSNGNFHVGYQSEDFRDKTCPKFGIVYHGNNRDIKVIVWLKIAGFRKSLELISPGHVSEFLFVLDALAESEKLPMCIGIGWAEELVSIFLQQSAAKTITTTGEQEL